MSLSSNKGMRPNQDIKFERYRLIDLMNPNKRTYVTHVERVVEGKPNELMPLGELRREDRIIMRLNSGQYWTGIMHNRTHVNLVMVKQR